MHILEDSLPAEQPEDMNRRDYMLKVAYHFIAESPETCQLIHYDGTDCDAWCLLDDLKAIITEK